MLTPPLSPPGRGSETPCPPNIALLSGQRSVHTYEGEVRPWLRVDVCKMETNEVEMAQDNVKRTGMIGLGAMGLQMGRRMVQKGFDVSGYDVSADAAKKAEGHGVRICGSVADAARNAEVIFVIVANDKHI